MSLAHIHNINEISLAIYSCFRSLPDPVYTNSVPVILIAMLSLNNITLCCSYLIWKCRCSQFGGRKLVQFSKRVKQSC